MISLKQLEKLALDNSPALLTAFGAAGTVATAVLAAKGHYRAMRKLEALRMSQRSDEPELTRKEEVKLVWKHYAPPVVLGGVTIGSIVMANRVGTKRAAAMAVAYTISEKTFEDYREKVAEKFGENKERDVRDDLVRDRIKNNPPNESNIVMVGTGDTLCCDIWSHRYFRSSMEELKKAQNEINYQILHHGYASLTDFYDTINIPRTQESDMIGWNQDKLLELEFTGVINEEGEPTLGFRFQSSPIRRFDKLHP